MKAPRALFPIITKFQPFCNRRFILEIPGVDVFLVKSVERAPYVRPKERWNRDKPDWKLLDELLAPKKLVVTLHNVITPSTEQQVQNLIDANEDIPEVKLKFLDPVGAVMGTRVYYRVKLERVDYDLLTYDAISESNSEIKLVFSYNHQKLLV